jgi:hypothetical protein
MLNVKKVLKGFLNFTVKDLFMKDVKKSRILHPDQTNTNQKLDQVHIAISPSRMQIMSNSNYLAKNNKN